MSDVKLLKRCLKCFKEENAELRKDKARLDWLLKYEGNYWLLENREDIDEEMEKAQ